jgi:hypothetical protein
VDWDRYYRVAAERRVREGGDPLRRYRKAQAATEARLLLGLASAFGVALAAFYLLLIR